MKPTNISPNRRSFLLGATLGTAGAVAGAAALVASVPTTDAVVATLPAADAETGYRMTPHIKHYYETTKL
ncbi:MAG: formate dehydrogenase [Rhodocyclaceae bacterium]|nr:formate dehydrogenase [Rhodocyclaceae bacterium]MCA3023795.1 formate dehydrogenase [Rhodocyclaceae bacterium]MCA3030628.1 formate dehydrogenase [Rhodocyclaceae bacterium]MCA3034057.1 formate dehydrogenase [Rhodocyclaceae bacterium]MCA3035782.1 formate dehydrogenase [Rhodocyclaceae bacterium]